MVEGIKSVSEQNAEATKRMAELAELNRQQAVQVEDLVQSMAILAYDAKRDNEVMKAIIIVTLIFLPATFVSVSSIPGLEFTTYPPCRLQTIFSMGFFNIEYDQIGVSRQGWIYLACTFPLTVVVVGASYAWIWWTGTKVENPSGKVLGRAADPVFRRGAGPDKVA